MNLEAVILTAGQGTRMKSNTPKVLHKIGGLPLIGHLLHLTTDLEIDSPNVIIGGNAQNVESYVKTHKNQAICLRQDEPLGSGHALKCAENSLIDHTGNLLVLCGDVPFIKKNTVLTMLNELDLGADLVVLGFKTDKPTNYGRMVIKDGNRLKEIIEEKEASKAQKKIKICNAGVYCGSAKLIFSLLSNLQNENKSDEYYLTDIVKATTDKQLNTKVVITNMSETQGINTKKDLAAGELYFQNQLRQRALENGITLIDPKTVYFSYDTEIGKDTVIHPNVILGPSVKIQENVEILAFSHLEGCIIEKGSKIGPFARVRPGTYIEEDVKIGNFVEIKKTTLKTGAKANHLAYVGDAEIGSGTNIGAGTIFSNYDGVFKHSTQVGKNAFIGSNSSLIAPVRIGANAVVGSGSVISIDVPNDALAISRTSQKNKKNLGKRIIEKLKSMKNKS